MAKLNVSVPSVDLNNYLIDAEVVKSIPERIARKHKMIPLFKIRDALTVAIANPSNPIALDEARAISGCSIQPLKGDESQILKAIDQYYNVSNSIEEIIKDLQKEGMEFAQEEKLDLIRLQRIAEEPPVIKLVNLILAQALKDNASDIHIEPQEDNVQVRIRVDGVLHNLASFPRGIGLPVVPRIKVISGLDITERRKPQDGRFRVRIEDREIDLRISTFPVAFGEKVVMRLLDHQTAFLSLEKMGFNPQVLNKFESLIAKPYGIILVTGPTGSGKTSTLYAVLNKLNSKGKNITTLEEPREYLLEGVNQGEVNTEIDFTFANGLRAILRQDPDIIMVGEIRDLDTAQIAIRASLTGHLVLSTLHTNDAASAVTRLIDMGIEPFLIASSVIGVLAQRLVRVICSNCKEEVAIDKCTPSDILKSGVSGSKLERVYHGKGCLFCKHTGYKGRIGIFELMPMDDNLRALVTENRPLVEIKNAAKQNGMKTLRQDGYNKVAEGITTLEEVARVTFGEE